MPLLQRYIFSQAFLPAILSLSALAILALLTQSLQTLDLIVENRQSATTFLYITILALPQLIGIIMPLAVFMAAIYALNRMTSDSELIVAKANGVSPWSIGTSIVRLGVYALLFHIFINLVFRSETATSLLLENGSVQTPLTDGSLDVVAFETYQLDLSDVVALDNVLRLKSSDKFLHDLLRPDPRDYITPKSRRELAAEGHARLATPLYNLALVLLALAFLLRGQHSKLGHGRKITICAVLGFSIRLIGFGVASSAEGNPALNILQYILPIGVALISFAYLMNRKQIRLGTKRAKASYKAALDAGSTE